MEKQAVKIFNETNRRFYKETVEILNNKLGKKGIAVAKRNGHLANLKDEKSYYEESFTEDIKNWKSFNFDTIEDFLTNRVNKIVNQYREQLITIIEDTEMNIKYNF